MEPVPYDRFATKVEELRLAKEEHATVAAELATLQAAAGSHTAEVDKWRSKYESERTTLEGERKGFAAERSMLAAGITDPDLQDLVRYRHGKLPEEGRPAIGEWLAGDAKADRWLAPHLAAQASPDEVTGDQTDEQGGDSTPQAPRPAPPKLNAGTSPDSTQPTVMTRDAYHDKHETLLAAGDTAAARELSRTYHGVG